MSYNDNNENTKIKKVTVDGFVDKDVVDEFSKLSMLKHGPKHGFKGRALKEALIDWNKKTRKELFESDDVITSSTP